MPARFRTVHVVGNKWLKANMPYMTTDIDDKTAERWVMVREYIDDLPYKDLYGCWVRRSWCETERSKRELVYFVGVRLDD